MPDSIAGLLPGTGRASQRSGRVLMAMANCQARQAPEPSLRDLLGS